MAYHSKHCTVGGSGIKLRTKPAKDRLVKNRQRLRRSRNSGPRQTRVCESLEHATTGDHVIAVAADIQACIEDGTVSQIVRQRTLAATAALTLA